MPHWKTILAYDGTPYHGWQIQPHLPTIQGTLAQAIRHITGEAVLPQGSGRTDAGVHALAQVATFTLDCAIPDANLHRALNRALPPSIRVLSVEAVPPDFHARHSALRKTYEYRILPGDRICSPMLAPYVWACRPALDLALLNDAATRILGTHDFTSFAAADPDLTTRTERWERDKPAEADLLEKRKATEKLGRMKKVGKIENLEKIERPRNVEDHRKSKDLKKIEDLGKSEELEKTEDTGKSEDLRKSEDLGKIEMIEDLEKELVISTEGGAFAAAVEKPASLPPLSTSNTRTIFHSSWQLQDELLLYRITGSGFLHHMVRNLVGTFVEAGAGRIPAASIPAILATRSRSAAGPTAPACGLFLVNVEY